MLQPGLLFYQEHSDSNVQTYKLNLEDNVDGEPTTLPVAGLSRERHLYLVNNVRQHVRQQFQNAFCPAMVEE